MHHLNWIDYVIIAILALSTLAGLARGLVKEIISLLTLVAAFVVATSFASPVAEYFSSNASATTPDAAQTVSYAALGLSFGVLFLGTVIVGALVGFIINLILKSSVLGIGNRIFGAVFGFARGFLINLVLIFLVQLTSFTNDAAWQESMLLVYFQPSVVWLTANVSPHLESLKEKLTSQHQAP